MPGGQSDTGRVSAGGNGLIDVEIVAGLQSELGIAAPAHGVFNINIAGGTAALNGVDGQLGLVAIKLIGEEGPGHVAAAVRYSITLGIDLPLPGRAGF